MVASIKGHLSRLIHLRNKQTEKGLTDEETSGKAAARSAQHRKDKAEKAQRAKDDRNDLAGRRQREDEEARQSEDKATRDKYGDSEGDWDGEHPNELVTIESLRERSDGDEVLFKARVHQQRSISPSITFIIFRHQETTIQGVLSTVDGASEHMVKWTQRLPPETLVNVSGKLVKPPQVVQSTTIHELEIHIRSIHTVQRAAKLPFDVSHEESEPVHKRFANRIVDLRHPANQAIFRIRARFMREFRRSLEQQDFLEITTPKLQAAASESGAAVFKLNYFGREAVLAQSPQLAKQMAISADFERVYEIGPVFRAENSNDHRHMTEYTGLDLEMAIVKNYHEIITILLNMLGSAFEAIMTMRQELDLIRERWPGDDLVFSEEIPILPFEEGIDMLRDCGEEVEIEDLSTAHEIKLGELVKAKYHTDLFVLDKFPTSARPFYTYLDGKDRSRTNSFDIFLRGQEICTGGQRITDPHELRRAMAASGVDASTMTEYLEAFDWGIPPHGGAGLGLDRLIFLALNLGDIRFASLFIRDPKSLPATSPGLPHPDASTRPSGDKEKLPPVEDLIANYGDSTNTSWLDRRYEIWRHPNGAAMGYSRQNHLVIIAGDPLCEKDQFPEVIKEFLQFVHHQIKLDPVWLLVGEAVQEILGAQLGWRTLVCAEEQRLGEDRPPQTQSNRDREMHKLQQEHVSVHQVTDVDDEFRSRVDRRIADWKANRQSSSTSQVHLTDITPWQDMRHRKYFVAETKSDDHTPQAFVVLAQLSPEHGWQVKWALDFPGAPNGAIDALIHQALADFPGPITFGGGVAPDLVPVYHIHMVKAKLLSHTYQAIVSTLRLKGKSQFREKFGAYGDSQYICYPKRALTPFNLHEVVGFFEE